MHQKGFYVILFYCSCPCLFACLPLFAAVDFLMAFGEHFFIIFLCFFCFFIDSGAQNM